MHILLVSTYGFDPAFPSRPEQVQARALARRGHRVSAYEYLDRRYPGQSRPGDWLDGGIAVHRAPTLGFAAPTALLRLLLAERPDIIHIHHMRNLLSYQTVVAARRLGIPVVMTIHGLLHDGDLVVDRERPLEAPLRFDNLLLTPSQLLRRLARGAQPRRAFRNYFIHAPLRMLDGAVALSQHERGLLIQLGVAPERIVVLPNAVEIGDWSLEIDKDNRQSSIVNHQSSILFIGQLVHRKGFDLLARAIPLVVAEFPMAQFLLVSHNQHGGAELRQLVAEAGVAANVQLLGRVDEAEKWRLLREAAVVAVPSRYEGFGIPVIEAFAAGSPVVTMDAPATNELVQHDVNGLVTPYGDHAAFAAALLRLLHNPDLARRLGAAGQRGVAGRYTADGLAAQLEAWYQWVGARRRQKT
ncbi:MAG: glycosyltransferase family 4 protein [Chloroflexaceae bacterium]|jgi:glycosyltransferase involved in cell wall biosynthesis|nr:glycosyltransferase family 4 protein [Chloroflexaceae bacterium]